MKNDLDTTATRGAQEPPAGQRVAGILWAVLGAGLVVRLVLACTSVHTLILLNVPDDAFYGFKIAQNIAAGLGSTFDGLHPTNGYHPLWTGGILVLLCRAVPGRPELLVNLALVLQSLMDIGTTMGVYLIARAVLSSSGWAILAAALYAFNPNVIFYEVDGLETALGTLLMVAVLWIFIRFNGPEFRRWEHRFLFAVACGLMLLARTDTIFLCAVLFLLCAVQEWRVHGGIQKSFVMGVIVTLLVTPWLVWSYLRFHQIVQVSGMARPWVLRQNLHGSAFLEGLKLLKYELTYEWPVQNGLAGGVFVLVAITAFLLFRSGTRPKTPEKGWSVISWAWLALFLTILFHCFVRLHPRPWYSALFPVLNALTICWAGHRIWSLPRARRGISYALGLIFVVYVLTGLYTVWMKKYSWQGEFLRAAEWFRLNTPLDARVGAFNSGIIGYFSQRTVVNLDGVVNNSAFDALRGRQLQKYVWDNSITYIADFRFSVEVDHKRFWNGGRDELDLDREPAFPSYPIFWEHSGMRIYRVCRPAAQGGTKWSIYQTRLRQESREIRVHRVSRWMAEENTVKW